MNTNMMESAVQFMQDNNIALIVPELILTSVILIAVAMLTFSKSSQERQGVWQVALGGLFCTLVSLGVLWGMDYIDNPKFLSLGVMGGIFNADLLSLVVRTLLVFGTMLVMMFCRTFMNKKSEVPGEFYVILLSALLGGMMLSGANDLIMVFVSLETLSISSYILVAYLRGNVLSAEAGLKYLLYGGMATAILLFGFSILYGLTGSTGFGQIAAQLQSIPPVHPIVLAIMSVMIVGGICFKLSAAPFHMWAPDVYEGAPTPVVAFLSVVSKIAAFSFAIRLFAIAFGDLQGWTGLISVLAVTSMVIGNVVALTQRNIKRLLAYSTVAHVGYLLLGLVILTPAGLSSLLYYLTTYLFMNLGAFAVVVFFENQTGRTDIAAFAGFARKRPWQAFVFSIMLLSLAGIPITAGFFGKFFLFQAVANAGSQYLWLVVVALLTSTVSLYYYLNVIRVMVIADPSDAVDSLPAKDTESSGLFSPVGLVLSICLIGTLVLGVGAQNFMVLSGQAVQGLLAPSAMHAQTAPEHQLSQVR